MTKKDKSLIVKTLVVFTFIVVFLFSAWTSLDPDFGYRLRTGQMILSSGFPKTDTYSYTMPSFSYVEHAWAVAVLWALAFPLVGKLGLALIWSVLAFVAIGISLQIVGDKTISKLFQLTKDTFLEKLGYFGLFPVLIAISVVMPFVGIRAQIVSWVMFSILLWLIFKKDLLKKGNLVFIPLFFIWANLHGSFLAGLFVLTLVIALRSLREKKINWIPLLVLTFSVLATFINPYRTGVWREVFQSIIDTKLRWSISEWMPAIFMADMSLAAMITLATMLIYRFRKRFKLEKVGLYLLLLIQALASRRHLSLWIIVALPITLEGLDYFYEEIRNIKFAKSRFKKALVIAWVGSLIILLSQSFFTIRNAFSLNEPRFYPEKAVEVLKENLPSGKIFSEYGWGGYLIWKLPEKKVFIDGRMPSWRWEGYPQGETGHAFDDYKDILEGELDYKKEFEKYGIDTVLWPAPREKNILQSLGERLENTLEKFGREKKDFNLLDKLAEDGWNVVYNDEVSVIYSKSK